VLSRRLQFLTSGHSDVQGWASECPDVKNYKWRLNSVWHRMLYSCTHMATVSVNGLILTAPHAVSSVHCCLQSECSIRQQAAFEQYCGCVIQTAVRGFVARRRTARRRRSVVFIQSRPSSVSCRFRLAVSTNLQHFAISLLALSRGAMNTMKNK